MKGTLVATKYFQRLGVDSNETFPYVARLDHIRILIALTTQNGWKIHQLDVKFSLLNGALEEEVHGDQPQDFVVTNEEYKVSRLKKALNGQDEEPDLVKLTLTPIRKPLKRVQVKKHFILIMEIV